MEKLTTNKTMSLTPIICELEDNSKRDAFSTTTNVKETPFKVKTKQMRVLLAHKSI